MELILACCPVHPLPWRRSSTGSAPGEAGSVRFNPLLLGEWDAGYGRGADGMSSSSETAIKAEQ